MYNMHAVPIRNLFSSIRGMFTFPKGMREEDSFLLYQNTLY